MSAPWVIGRGAAARVVERHLASALARKSREEAATRAMHRCARVWRKASEALGPASGSFAVWTHLMQPCAEALSWSPGREEAVRVGGVPMRAAIATLGPDRQLLLAMPWGTSQDGLRRAATSVAAEWQAPWVGACNGLTWRWYDASRPFVRDHVGLDLAQGAVDGRVWQALWLLGLTVHTRGADRSGDVPWIERIVAASVSDGAGAAKALRDGVDSALADLARVARGGHDDHLTLVLQWLFLLFAEARSLVPTWHPAHARSYAITTLAREAVSSTPAPVGVHESLVAIGRLHREGTVLAGTIVRPLEGPLFGPTLTARRGGSISDAQLGAVLGKLLHGGRGDDATIDFAQLDVEHLGSLYEGLMAPRPPGGGPQLARKRTGAFYTPRSMADLLVERTLDPLVRTASSDEILALRVLDPAMGSGALLASAHRFLVSAVEAAWVREGRGGPLDISRNERESLPRRVAEQCLFGADVDANAVQVSRLSLWLLSLAPERPLTWLDAHLRLGDSLVGVSPATILARGPTHVSVRRVHAGQLTLFELEQWHHEAAQAGPLFAALSARPTDSAGDAHEKARLLRALRGRSALAAWRARADAWCGAAMDDEASSGGVWRAVDDSLRDGGGQPLQGRGQAVERAAKWRAMAEARYCLHWSLEFPDVFEAGRGGFDAVIANPPWEMLRSDLGDAADRAERRAALDPLMRFVRRSALYRDTTGHVNSYQLFVERMLQLLRAGGRIGCLLPGGVLADHGAAALRRHLLDHAAVDRVSVFDNRDALFPIHRSMRIVAVTGTRGSATEGIAVDEGVPLRLSSRHPRSCSEPRFLSRQLLRRASGESEAIPSLRDAGELGVFERLLACPRLGGEWRVGFGRELNATEDRHLWQSGTPRRNSLTIVDGKHLQPFSVDADQHDRWMSPDEARDVLPDAPWTRWRLAYRDVSAPTNTRSLICALLPPGIVSTHTVFCLRTRLALSTQLYLCGMLNSLVADWFVRRYLASHVTTRLMANVPVPRVPATDARRRRVVRLAARLMRSPRDDRAHLDLQITTADLYGLDGPAMSIVTADFPKLPALVRDALTTIASTPSRR